MSALFVVILGWIVVAIAAWSVFTVLVRWVAGDLDGPSDSARTK